MKAKDIKIGGRYYAKVSGTVQAVRVIRTVERFGFNDNGRTHWICINTKTQREIEVKSAQRFRSEIPDPRGDADEVAMRRMLAPSSTPPADGSPGPKAMSDLFRL
jgi:hypothetical protein